MCPDMTRLSRESFERATMEDLTVEEAVNFLEREAKVRTLREKLEKYARGRDLKKLLVDGLMEHHPDMNRDSVDRRVRGWLKPEAGHSIRKQDALEVAFILKLSVEEADDFVTLVSEEHLHWRNPEEVVYIFALQNNMTYPEAAELEKRLQGILSQAGETKKPEEESFTPIIRSKISRLSTEEELTDYLKHEAGRLGKCHNTAYQLFMDWMDVLENPKMDDLEEQGEVFEREHLTVRDVLREYLYEEHVLRAKDRVRNTKKAKVSEQEKFIFTKIQEGIASSWPDETTISKMKSRKLDVNRKVLILLLLAIVEVPDDLEENDVFDELYRRVNDMLIDCGYSTLDPRVPFDWLIIYCMCAEDLLDLDDRMHRIFSEMFG